MAQDFILPDRFNGRVNQLADQVLIERAQMVAGCLLRDSIRQATPAEESSSQRLARLLQDEAGRDFILSLTDQVLRIRSPRRSARRLRDLIRSGVPSSLSALDRTGLRLLGLTAPLLPGLTKRAVDWRIDRDTRDVILAAEEPAFNRHVVKRTAAGFALNFNILGEAILGDEEAEARCRAVLALMARPDVTYVSVKISALCANLDVLAEEYALSRVIESLTRIFDSSKRTGTFVNLDMEEFRDLHLSLHGFMRTLAKDEFLGLEAGIVLQGYIPDSHDALRQLCSWANARRARGGAGIKIRIVKGANLAMELVEAEVHGWQPAPYPSKLDVDASYKLLLDHALAWGDADAVRIGVASHNLFDIAWALTLRTDRGAHDRVEIEMLEGMAPPQARAVRDYIGSLLLYSPIVRKRERDASIAYLSRRLDENSSPENFLRALFNITPESADWAHQSELFARSVEHRHSVSTISRRGPGRPSQPRRWPEDGTFRQAEDTDFTVADNRAWIREHFRSSCPEEPTLVTSFEDADLLVSQARAAQVDWAKTSYSERRRILARVAEVLESHRGRTITAMAHGVGKTVREGDPEVSEAIDFATYAAHLTLTHEEFEHRGATWTPYSVTLVAGPWNFPFAIPACGLVHAIAAGSAAILKPAPEARAIGAILVQQLHEAGVPRHLVQLAPTPDDEVGRHLITHPEVDLVVLTGSLTTARLFQQWRPDLNLIAETSGKNAIVITSAADIDSAIKDLVKSAFGHAGQKCSAASLAIIEAAVYDNPTFQERLADAVRSVRLGDSIDLATTMGPLISEPTGPLFRALTSLEPGESWLVEPRKVSDQSWSAGVRRDVRPGSWFHLTECFGPVVGLMRARDLNHAIELQNMTAYGLTAGIESLNPAEIKHWCRHVEAGNLYVNRHITGAVVRRQPFGGWKASSVGFTRKPGGPDHLHSYGTWAMSTGFSDDFAQVWSGYYCQRHDPSALASEINILRYRPLSRVIARVATDVDTAPLHRASEVSGVALEISEVSTEPDEMFAARLTRESPTTHLRYLAEPSDHVLKAAHNAGVTIDRNPVTPLGRLELSHWVREQTVSIAAHRYGRIIPDLADTLE